MNNINQKNTVLSFNEKNSLPYGEYDVKYQNGTAIDSINLNNTFNQLVENDLYIEKQLTFLSDYQVGPKVFDGSISTTQVDGYKYWAGLDEDANLSILHKVNEELSNTLDVVYSNGSPITGNVHYLIGFSGKYFAGVDNVILTSNNGKVWESYENTKSLTYYRDNEKLILPFNSDIKLLSTNSDDQIQFVKINQSSFGGEHPTAINIDEDNNIYVGTDAGNIWNALYGQYSDLLRGNIEFHKTQLTATPRGDVRDIIFRSKNEQFTDKNYIMASLSSGIFESGYARELRDKNIVSPGTGIRIYDACVYNDILYVATSNGLYTFDQNGFNRIGSITTPVFALQKYGSGSTQTLLLLQKNASTNFLQVYDLENNEVVIAGEVAITGSEQPTDFEYFVNDEERVFIYSTNQRLYCTIQDDSKKVSGWIVDADIREIKATVLSGVVYIYVALTVGGDSKFRLYTITKVDGKFIQTYVTDDIDGVNIIKAIQNQNSDKLYNFRNKIVYVDNNHIKSVDERLDVEVGGLTGLDIIRQVDVGSPFPDRGLIVKAHDSADVYHLRYINAIYKDVVYEINISGVGNQSSVISEIKDIILGTNHHYLITNNTIYMCKFQINNMFTETESYTFTVEATCSMYDIRKGLMVYNDACVQVGTNLVKLTPSTIDTINNSQYKQRDSGVGITTHNVNTTTFLKETANLNGYFSIYPLDATNSTVTYQQHENIGNDCLEIISSWNVPTKDYCIQATYNNDIVMLYNKTDENVSVYLTSGVPLYDTMFSSLNDIKEFTLINDLPVFRYGYNDKICIGATLPRVSAWVPYEYPYPQVGTVWDFCNPMEQDEENPQNKYVIDKYDYKYTDYNSQYDDGGKQYQASQIRLFKQGTEYAKSNGEFLKITRNHHPQLRAKNHTISAIMNSCDVLFNDMCYLTYNVLSTHVYYHDVQISLDVSCTGSQDSSYKYNLSVFGLSGLLDSSQQLTKQIIADKLNEFDGFDKGGVQLVQLSDNFVKEEETTNNCNILTSQIGSYNYSDDTGILCCTIAIGAEKLQDTELSDVFPDSVGNFRTTIMSRPYWEGEAITSADINFPETHVYGVESMVDIQNVALDYNHFKIADKCFQKMFPLVNQHAALYDGTNLCIDYLYDYTLTEENVYIPLSGTISSLFQDVGGTLRDVESKVVNTNTDGTSKAVVVALIKQPSKSVLKIKNFMVKTQETVTESEEDSPTTYVKHPYELIGIDTSSVWLETTVDIKKIALNTYSERSPSIELGLYYLDTSGNLYYQVITTSTSTGGSFTPSSPIATGVIDIICDCNHNYVYKVINKNGNITIQTLDESNPIAMETNIPYTSYSETTIGGVGNTNVNANPYGLVVKDGINLYIYDIPTNESKLYSSLEIANNKEYNKIRYSNGILFVLEGTTLKIYKNWDLINFPTQDWQLSCTDVYDFGITGDKLYVVQTSDKTSINVYNVVTRGGSIGLEQDGTITTGYEINKLVPYDGNWYDIFRTADDGNKPANGIRVAFSDSTLGVLSVVTSQIPYIENSDIKISNLGDIYKNDNNEYYILKSDVNQIHKLNGNYTNTILCAENTTSLIPTNIGFGCISSSNYVIQKDENTRYTLTGVTSLNGLWHTGNKFYAVDDSHLYDSKNRISNVIECPEKFNEDNTTVYQIRPIDNTFDAYLVTNSGSKKRYSVFRFSESNINDVKVYGTTTQSFEQALMIDDTSNEFIKFIYDGQHGSDYQIYHGVGDEILQQWFVDNPLGCTPKIGFHIDDYYYVITQENTILSFTGYNPTIRKFEKITDNSLEEMLSPGKFIDLGGNKFLLASETGAYYINNNIFVRISNNFSIGTLKYINQTTGTRLLFTLSNDIRTTNNYKKITDKSDRLLELSPTVSRVNDVMRLNDYDLVFATDKGMYATNYTYTLQNDLTYFTERQVNQIYNDLLSGRMTDEISNVINAHEAEYHNDKSLITRINRSIQDPYLSKTPFTWTYIDGDNDNSVISNDMISTVYFGNDKTGGISVLTHNFLGDGTPEFDSIEKKYHSGLTELYILVDTTNTYYINHISGAGYSSPGDYSYVRKNLEQFGAEKASVSCSSNALNELKTSISVIFDTSKYDIDNTMEVHINGCSLPLKIYGDLDGDADRSRTEILDMYQSLIVPSRLSGKMKTDDNMGLLVFSCFGTDQQSIKLSFW